MLVNDRFQPSLLQTSNSAFGPFAPMYERAFAREALRWGRCVFEEVLSGVR